MRLPPSLFLSLPLLFPFLSSSRRLKREMCGRGGRSGEGGNSMGLILDARSHCFLLSSKSVYLHTFSLYLGACP